MDSYTTVALDWLAGHPNPETITTDPRQWAEQTSAEITNRIRHLVDQLAPTIPGEAYPARRARLTTAETTATELALDELLPPYEPNLDRRADWTPLVPDLSDLL
jgi:hypothetical protein